MRAAPIGWRRNCCSGLCKSSSAILLFKDLHKLPMAADNKIELSSHYAAVEESAERIIDFSIDETVKLLREPRRNA